MNVVAVAESSELGDIPLTPAQRATLRRHVDRVKSTMRPQSKPRTDVRHLFQKQEPAGHKTSKTDDVSRKQHKDSAAPCATDVNMFVLLHLIYIGNADLLSVDAYTEHESHTIVDIAVI